MILKRITLNSGNLKRATGAQVTLVPNERELDNFADQVYNIEKRNGISKVELSI